MSEIFNLLRSAQPHVLFYFCKNTSDLFCFDYILLMNILFTHCGIN